MNYKLLSVTNRERKSKVSDWWSQLGTSISWASYIFQRIIFPASFYRNKLETLIRQETECGMTKVKALLLERVRSRATLKSMASRLCHDSLYAEFLHEYDHVFPTSFSVRQGGRPVQLTSVYHPLVSLSFPPPARWHIVSDRTAISASGDLGRTREGKDEKEAEMRLVMLWEFTASNKNLSWFVGYYHRKLPLPLSSDLVPPCWRWPKILTRSGH